MFSLFSARAFSAHPSRSLRAAENQHKRWEIWPPTLAALQRNGQPPCHGSAELKMTISAAERYRSKWDFFFFPGEQRSHLPPRCPQLHEDACSPQGLQPRHHPPRVPPAHSRLVGPLAA